MKRISRVSQMLCGVALLTAAPARGANDATKEFIGYGVENFTSAGACQASNLSKTIDEAQNLRDVFSDWIGTGDWGESVLKADLNVDGRDFTDAGQGGSTCESYQPACSKAAADETESTGCDSADVCLLSTHGDSSIGNLAFRYVMGDVVDDCKISSANDLRFGNNNALPNGDTEIFIADSCHSGDYDIYNASTIGNGVFNMVDSTSTFSTYLGYHGCAPDRASFITHYGEASYENGVGENWLIEAVQWPLFGGDTCPVAIVFGDNGADRDHMYEWGGFNDREDTGVRSAGATYYYWQGCDPDCDGALPN